MMDALIILDINHLITIALIVFISCFILFIPDKQFNAEEEEWSEKYNENFQSDGIDPVNKLVIPPEAFLKNKSSGYAKGFMNQIFNKNISKQVEGTTDVLLSVPGMNGTFNIKHIDNDSTPLICFIDSKSGGKHGEKMMKLLKCYLNPTCQVIDICTVSPEPIIQSLLTNYTEDNGIITYNYIKGLLFLVCGGDGTICQILNCINKCYSMNSQHNINIKPPQPPIAILPSGTGNDLSNVLGWGCGLNDEAIEDTECNNEQEMKQCDFNTSASEVVGDLIQTSAISVGNSIQSLSNSLLDRNNNDFVDVHTVLSRIASCCNINEYYGVDRYINDECECSRPFERYSSIRSDDSAEKITKITSLDRWVVEYQDRKGDIGDVDEEHMNTITNTNITLNNIQNHRIFYNYFSIGVDAQILYNIHQLRLQSPEHFVTQWSNKLWYGLVGGHQIISQDCKKITEHIHIYVDEVEIELPSGIEGIVFSNIQSYAGGCHMWGVEELNVQESAWDDSLPSSPEVPISSSSNNSNPSRHNQFPNSHDQFKNATSTTTSTTYIDDKYNDGIIEIMGIGNSFHLAQIKMGLSSCYRIAQIDCRKGNRSDGDDSSSGISNNTTASVPRKIRVVTTKPLPMQMDGEPWMEKNNIELLIDLYPLQSAVMTYTDIDIEEPIQILTESESPSISTSHILNLLSQEREYNENDSVHSSMFYTDIEEY